MDASARFAATLLRVSLGSMWLAHGLWKAFTLGPVTLAAFLESRGLPGAMALPLTLVEIGGGLALLLGLHGRIVSLALAPILLGALLIHLPNGLIFANTGGGYEYPLFLIAGTAVHVLLGDGALALTGIGSKSSGEVIVGRWSVLG